MIKGILRLLYEVRRFAGELLWGVIRNNDSTIGGMLRSKMCRTVCAIDTNVFIKCMKHFVAGKGSCLYHSCYILNSNGKFILGNGSHLGAFCYVNVCHGTVKIGDDVAIGPGTMLVAYSNHYQPGEKITDVKVTKDITVGNNVLVGANCTILPGTVIPNNVVIGAGSVVKGELEPDSIYVGMPCRKIRSGWYGRPEVPECDS
jgi:acetyltransferase-like isoleucine patch superfamily enzyme